MVITSAKSAAEQQAPPPPSRSVMVRSLRRRLWKALQEEDVQTAMRAYTATKVDYERWIDEELAEEERTRKREAEKKDQKYKVRGWLAIQCDSCKNARLTYLVSGTWCVSVHEF